MHVAVVGGGVVGLTTGIRVLETFPHADVCLWTHKAPEEMTSFGPPGLFLPHSFAAKEKVKRWAETSFRRLSTIYANEEAAEAGMALVSGAMLSDDPNELPQARQLYGSIVHGFRELDAEERRLYSAVEYGQGWSFTSFVTPGRSYVPYLRRRYAALGGRVRVAKLTSLTEVPPPFDIILNCAGVDASTLAGTDDMVPAKGLLIRLDAPWQKNFAMVDAKTLYVFPSLDSVYVGSIRELGQTELTVAAETRERLLRDVYEHWPSLRRAPILDEWVGLRPWRPQGPRVEAETIQGRLLVHNYGHGNNGFTLSWGTAEEVIDILKEHFAKAKL